MARTATTGRRSITRWEMRAERSSRWWRSCATKATERKCLLRQCRVAVHERSSAFHRDLHECPPGEAAGPHVAIFPAAHSGERHPECMREGFLREPGTLTPCPNHAGGIGRRHGLLGRGVRVDLNASKSGPQLDLA